MLLRRWPKRSNKKTTTTIVSFQFAAAFSRLLLLASSSSSCAASLSPSSSSLNQCCCHPAFHHLRMMSTSSNPPSPFSGKKVHQSALALLPEEATPLYTSIQALRQRHDKHFKRWPPHINVLYPFVPEAEFEAAAEALHKALATVAPIEDCVLANIGHFEHGKKFCTAWLAPQTSGATRTAVQMEGQEQDQARPPPHPAIIDLQKVCETAIPHCNDLTASFGGRYTPHLSLGQFKTRQNVNDFVKEAQWQSHDFPVRHVCLLSREGFEDPFHIRYIVPLGGQGEIIKVPASSSSPSSSAAAAATTTTTTTSTSTPAPSPELAPAEIEIDGSKLEGGGQILRVSTALATLLGKSLRIHSIRAGRSKPGLQPQHLAGIKLVAEIGQAQLQNGTIGSTTIRLEPPSASSVAASSAAARKHGFFADPGTAGSITLLLQASLPCCLALVSSSSSSSSSTPVKLTLRGGTSVSHSPAIEYWRVVTAPLLARMGLHTHTHVQRRGYFPQGGGQVEVKIDTHTKMPLEPIELVDPGVPLRVLAFVSGIVNVGGQTETSLLEGLQGALEGVVKEVFVAGVGAGGEGDSASAQVPVTLEAHIEKQTPQQQEERGGGRGGGGGGKRRRLRPKREVLHLLFVLETSRGCRLGADVLLEKELQQQGEEGQDKQREICQALVKQLHALHSAGACVDEHMMDQLILYMALAKKGAISRVRGPATRGSLHVETAIHVCEQILGVKYRTTMDEEGGGGCVLVEVEGMGWGGEAGGGEKQEN